MVTYVSLIGHLAQRPTLLGLPKEGTPASTGTCLEIRVLKSSKDGAVLLIQREKEKVQSMGNQTQFSQTMMTQRRGSVVFLLLLSLLKGKCGSLR